MTAVQTIDGPREILRGPDGIVMGGHGVLGVEAWLLSTDAAAELMELLSGLHNDSRPSVLGAVEVTTNIGRRSLSVVLAGAAVELLDRRKLSLIRWTLRMVDQVQALHDALADALAADAITEPVVVPEPIDPADVPQPEGPKVLRTQSVRDRFAESR
jgi:hypothetical protein